MDNSHRILSECNTKPLPRQGTFSIFELLDRPGRDRNGMKARKIRNETNQVVRFAMIQGTQTGEPKSRGIRMDELLDQIWKDVLWVCEKYRSITTDSSD